MKIMMSAGEVSGDLHGAGLARELRRQAPTVELIALGGEKMAAQGVRLIRNFADYNVMGVWEVIKNLRRILRLLDDLTLAMEDEQPDLLVLIDYPDFNWRLAKRAKALGVPVFSYIPPSAWAWRKGRAKACAKLADELCAIFPFELPVYQRAGANIYFVGNPLVDTVQPTLTRSEAAEFFGLAAGDIPVLLLPGSRRQEITMLLAPMLEAAKIIKEAKPAAKFFLPVADAALEGLMRQKIAGFSAGIDINLTNKYTYDLMGLAAVAMATSGTVVMEAALMGLPCVVLYRMARLSYAVGKILVHIENFSLPNILLGERLQPELLQDEVEPQRIAAEVLRLFPGEARREYVLARLKDAAQKLGEPGAAGRVAAKILAAAQKYSKK